MIIPSFAAFLEGMTQFCQTMAKLGIHSQADFQRRIEQIKASREKEEEKD